MPGPVQNSAYRLPRAPSRRIRNGIPNVHGDRRITNVAGPTSLPNYWIRMKSTYLGELTKLLEQARPLLASTHVLEFKNVFGAVAGYVDGNIFISCGKFGVALRLPPGALEEVFKEDGVERLRYFPNGHVKKEYAVFPQRMLEDQEQFRKLVDESVTYVCGG